MTLVHRSDFSRLRFMPTMLASKFTRLVCSSWMIFHQRAEMEHVRACEKPTRSRVVAHRSGTRPHLAVLGLLRDTSACSGWCVCESSAG